MHPIFLTHREALVAFEVDHMNPCPVMDEVLDTLWGTGGRSYQWVLFTDTDHAQEFAREFMGKIISQQVRQRDHFPPRRKMIESTFDMVMTKLKKGEPAWN